MIQVFFQFFIWLVNGLRGEILDTVAHICLEDMCIDPVCDLQASVHQVDGERFVIWHGLAVLEPPSGMTVTEFVRRFVRQPGFSKEDAQAFVHPTLRFFPGFCSESFCSPHLLSIGAYQTAVGGKFLRTYSSQERATSSSSGISSK